MLQGPGCFEFADNVPRYCPGKHHHKHRHEDDEGYYHANGEGPHAGYEEAAARQESYGSDEELSTGPESADYQRDQQDYPEQDYSVRYRHDKYNQGEPSEGYDHGGEDYPEHGRRSHDRYSEGEHHDGYEHPEEGYPWHGRAKHGYGGPDEEHEGSYEHPPYHGDEEYPHGHYKKHHGYGHHGKQDSWQRDSWQRCRTETHSDHAGSGLRLLLPLGLAMSGKPTANAMSCSLQWHCCGSCRSALQPCHSPSTIQRSGALV